MKKTLIAVALVTSTLSISAPAFADGKLPDRRPPCSIIRKTPLEPSVGAAACEHAARRRTETLSSARDEHQLAIERDAHAAATTPASGSAKAGDLLGSLAAIQTSP